MMLNVVVNRIFGGAVEFPLPMMVTSRVKTPAPSRSVQVLPITTDPSMHSTKIWIAAPSRPPLRSIPLLVRLRTLGLYWSWMVNECIGGGFCKFTPNVNISTESRLELGLEMVPGRIPATVLGLGGADQNE